MAYKRKGGPGPRAGFSLVEVIVSVALIALISTGFLYMMAANSQLLSREYRLDRSSYELGALADRGEGKAGERFSPCISKWIPVKRWKSISASTRLGKTGKTGLPISGTSNGRTWSE